jgi:hypothetical protein
VRAAALAALLLLAHSRALVLPFTGEDLAFLDVALRRPALELVSEPPPVGGSWRPLAREVHWWWWGKEAGLDAGGFHLLNLVAYLGSIALLIVVVARWLGGRPAWIAGLALALFPGSGAALAWASRVQELSALAWTLAAVFFHQQGRPTGTGIAAAAATLSWEGGAVVPLLLAAYDACGGPARPTDRRGARLVPPVIGVALALGLGLVVRGGWPRDVPAAWALAGLGELWRLPLEAARAWWPPGTGAGVLAAVRGAPIAMTLVAVAAMVATPGRGAAAGSRTSKGSPLRYAVAWIAIAATPVALLPEPWRGTSFLLAAPGAALAAGVLLSRVPAWPLRLAAALGAAVLVGANFLPGLPPPAGARRDPGLNQARVREEADRTDRLLSAIEPWCSVLRRDGETFVLGMPRGPEFDVLFGPGMSVACRDTGAVRPLSELTPAAARGDFALLRYDPESSRFTHEPADARVRRLIAVHSIAQGELPIATALLEASLRERDDPETRYLLASTLAASGASDSAAALWAATIRAGARPRADSMAMSLIAGLPGLGRDSAVAATRRLVRAALLDPTQAPPHAELGRHLVMLGRPRSGAVELGLAWGIGKRVEDLAWLATAYEGMGSIEDARAAYQSALSAGLRGAEYTRARDRFMRLERSRLDRSGTPP